jgi:hypothetical protein
MGVRGSLWGFIPPEAGFSMYWKSNRIRVLVRISGDELVELPHDLLDLGRVHEGRHAEA